MTPNSLEGARETCRKIAGNIAKVMRGQAGPTRQLLAALAGGGHVLMVAAFRSEEVAADHALRRIRPPLHLSLALFEPDDVRRLAESMAGPRLGSRIFRTPARPIAVSVR